MHYGYRKLITWYIQIVNANRSASIMPNNAKHLRSTLPNEIKNRGKKSNEFGFFFSHFQTKKQQQNSISVDLNTQILTTLENRKATSMNQLNKHKNYAQLDT